MDLERIAVMRAQEQIACRGRDLVWNSPWQAAPKPKVSNRHLKCECGDCRTCRKRIVMRRYRAHLDKPPPKRRGPSMALGRKCGCGRRIADWNRSGMCRRCSALAWGRANREHSKREAA
jgi:hypothetical protein